MSIRITTQTINGSTPNTADTKYKYLRVTIPEELRKLARLRPTDRLAVEVQGQQVRIKYDPDGGYQYKHGIISLNENEFEHEIDMTFDGVVPPVVEEEYLVINIPDEAFVIKRGFGVVGALIRKAKGFANAMAA